MISPSKLRKTNESFEQKTQVPTDENKNTSGDAVVPAVQDKPVEEEKAPQAIDTMLRSDIREEEVLLEKSPNEVNLTREEDEVAAH